MDGTQHHLNRVEEVIDELREALAARAPIEQAKGMLMQHLKCSADDAAAVLLDVSLRTGVDVQAITEALVVTATEIPPSAEPQPEPEWTVALLLPSGPAELTLRRIRH